MGYKIGIDLGTTFSAVAYINENKQPTIIKNTNGNTITPSVIYFGEDEPIVGEEAKERQSFGDTEVASFFKRSMGEEHFIEYFNDTIYNSMDLSSILLKYLKEIAEEELQTTVTEAVITVPAYFGNKQREETIEAGRKAGLHVKAIINEPTAAALAYGINTTIDQNLVVYDLGGGTFDVTIVECSKEQIKVLATSGDHALGGKDWDDRIIAHITERFEEKHHIDPLANLDTMNDLLVKGEQAKKTLTSRTTTSIPIVCDGIRENYTMTRENFEELTEDLMERTWSLTESTLREARLTWRHVSEVLLVGGSTRMPMVHDYIQKAIGKPPLKGVHPDEAVAIGAAIKANLQENEGDANKQTFSLGAPKKVVDVMSHSLGMVIMDKNKTKYINSILLRKNEPIPVRKKRTYQLQTRPGNNNEQEVYVTQGENQKPYECTIIGKYIVSNIQHQQGGLAHIEVTYAYDNNGVIQVSAIDKLNGVTLPVKREEVTGDLNWLQEAPVEEMTVEEKQRVAIVIAIDLSGSMAGNPLTEAQKAAQKFIDEMDLLHTSISLVGFADLTKVVAPLTSDYEALSNSINDLSRIFDRAELGYANQAEPFTKTLEVLEQIDDVKNLIVLTDGHWNNQEHARKTAQSLQEYNIEIIALGFGAASETFLKQIATTDEHALFTEMTQLVSSFSKIAQEINHTATGGLGTKKRGGFLNFF